MVFPLDIVPMLAHPSRKVAGTPADAVRKLALSGNWFFELKWDGARMLAVVRDGQARMFSREGNDMTYRYPEIRDALQVALPTGTWTLDGEALVFDKQGRPSFPLSHRRDAQATEAAARRLMPTMPAVFMAFDLLIADGHDVRNDTYEQRQALLEATTRDWAPTGTLRWMAPNTDGVTMWDFVNEQKLEGLVAKKRTSRYIGGRSYDWVKAKPVRSLSALVGNHSPRTGRGAGALDLRLVEDGKLIDIGSVGAGLTLHDVSEMHKLATANGYVVAEIEYMDLSPARQLRQPVFKGFRTDVPLTDCTIDQLELA